MRTGAGRTGENEAVTQVPLSVSAFGGQARLHQRLWMEGHMANPATRSVHWVVSTTDSWLAFETFNLSSASGVGVYIIWHEGQPGRVVKVGQGDIVDRLGAHRRDNAICAYRQYGKLFVTWAILPAAQLDGVERYLGDYWTPLVGDRFPAAVPIAVNQPF